MKRNPMYLCMVLTAAMFCIAAHASTYDINFTGSGLVPTSGSFNYDPVNGFSNFLVYWPQILGATPFNLTSAANNPIGGGCGTPTAALAFALLTHSLTGCGAGTYQWSAASIREGGQTLDFSYGPTSTSYAIDIPGTAYCSTCAASVGNFGSWTISVVAPTTIWKGRSSGGLWSQSANWTGGTPTASTDVFIDNGNPQNSAATLDIGGAQAHNLTIDSNDGLSFNNNTSLTINGSSISNAGNISLNSVGNHTDLILAGSNTVTLTGGGTVTLRNNINNRIYSAGNGTLINQETIQGAGQIGVGQTTITNSGVIDANVSGTLFIQPGAGGVTNTGTLEATAGGRLDLRGTYANTGGTINASGTSSVVALDGAVIHGGTLTSSSNGLIESINSATLNGVTIGAGTHYVTPNNTITVLQGTITNNGTIALNASLNNTDLQISGPVTLTGTGTLNLGNNPNNRIYALNGSDVLTNKGTIQGAGQLGVDQMGLVNAGTINANQSAGILLSTNSNGLNNTGTLRTAAGDTMHVTGGPFTNFSGTTLTGGSYVVAGTLEIDELGNTGGEIVTDAARITLVSSSAKFIDAAGNNALSKLATITSAGAFTISGTGDTYTTAGNFTNNGALNVGSGSKFDVNGNLTNFSGTTLRGGTYNISGQLQFNGANIVTNAARITLTGTASSIVNQTGTTNGLANFTTNAAAGSFTLASSRSFTTAGNFSNAGTVKVSKGSTFTVASTHNYTQTAGTTTNDGTMAVSSGGTFAFNGGSIFGNGGTFTGNVTSGGRFNIGDVAKTAAKLAITGAYAQSSSGALNIDIGGLTPGTLFDQFNVSGAATLGGTLSLDLINSFTPKLGSTFDIMNFASETGTFATINGTYINSSEHFLVVVNPSNVTLDVVSGAVPPPAASFGSTPTPEPSTLLLLSSGTLAGVAAYRRKLRRR